MKYIRVPKSEGNVLIRMGGGYSDPKVIESNKQFDTVGLPDEFANTLLRMGQPYKQSEYQYVVLATGKNTTAELKDSMGNVISTSGTVFLDELCTLTVTADTGYTLVNFTLSGADIVKKTTDTSTKKVYQIKVTGQVTLKTYDATDVLFDLAVETDENTNITVTLSDETEIQPGTDIIPKDSIVTITATAGDGYTLATLTVNNEDFTSGSTYTVTSDISIAATSEVSE